MASFFETSISFWFYDELIDISRFFTTEMYCGTFFWRTFAGAFATIMGLGGGIIHDKYLRKLVERPKD